MNIREKMFQLWYWYVNKIDKNAEVIFMNFGYHDEEQKLLLDKDNERDRYSIQLYHHLAAEVDLKGKDIVEVGCGRGGGLSYIVKQFSPSSAMGVDLDKEAISFCNRNFQLEGLSFKQGDAQKLDLSTNTYDVVFNVESSHRYPDMPAFLKEVRRILKPGGLFLFTDFRYDWEMDGIKEQLKSEGMLIERERIINSHVVSALELDNPRKHGLVKKLAPRFLHKTALNFAGAVGSETYKQFASGKYVYFSYVIKSSNTK